MADVKPFDAVFLTIALTDVIIKVTVEDLYSHIFGRCYCHYCVSWCYYPLF